MKSLFAVANPTGDLLAAEVEVAEIARFFSESSIAGAITLQNFVKGVTKRDVVFYAGHTETRKDGQIAHSAGASLKIGATFCLSAI